jgi:hypothetical protein
MQMQGVQNVPRSAWVKTDAASRRVSTDVAFAVLLVASVFTHAVRCILSVFRRALRGTLYQFLPTRCEVHSVGF